MRGPGTGDSTVKPQEIATSLLTALALVASGCGQDHADHAETTDAKAPCCSADAPAAAHAGALPGTSLYLLDSEWTDQSGASRQLGDFRGQVVVTAMIFTHCEYACPQIIADLQRIEGEIPEERRGNLRFLLVSMDTERDTPAVLEAFAKKREIETERWTLLHGDDFAVRGFAAALGVRYKRDVNGNFAHSNLITVLHHDGGIAHQLEGLNADTSESVSAILDSLPRS